MARTALTKWDEIHCLVAGMILGGMYAAKDDGDINEAVRRAEQLLEYTQEVNWVTNDR